MAIELTHVSPSQYRERAIRHAGLSMLIPGLGQFAQRRLGAALVQFGTVVAYVGGALSVGGHRALLLAVAWNLWSVIDAYRQESRS